LNNVSDLRETIVTERSRQNHLRWPVASDCIHRSGEATTTHLLPQVVLTYAFMDNTD